ncbi:MAG: alpha-amylase family glycosyl hydrolase [Treponema sp.]|nr:alpha-amylase family glycosyl hydrolase [Treponema sp.]
MSKWLENAIFYEIYPQSFYDSNGDGIGDIEGITQKLDYILSIGCNALWLNPCFDSPFKDAGYDVRDYKKVAPRYGTNADLARLFSEAHKRNMRVILDLVAGHTSEEHEWFAQSKKARPGAYANRYIWTDNWIEWGGALRMISGEADRSGSYMVNFFKSQPALNYGFLNPAEKWQLPMDHPDCVATREALKDVMRFWLDLGCDGFRVDMAGSLVKLDDEDCSGTCAIWREIRAMLDSEYPEAIIVAEWGCPEKSIPAGFHADFLLHFNGGAYNSLVRDYSMDKELNPTGPDNSFFKKGGSGDIRRFLDEYLPHYEATKNLGVISLITGNHDMPRLRLSLSPQEIALSFAFIFTMPGAPFLYYGDEIAMRYLRLDTKEGGYDRTGARSPMQWNSGKNLGFSSASSEKLYLSVDDAKDAPTVEAAELDPGSLLNTLRALLRLRHAEPDLQARPNLQIIFAEKSRLPFVYRRGSLLLAINPGAKEASAELGKAITAENAAPLFSLGDCSLSQGRARMAAQSFGIWKIK